MLHEGATNGVTRHSEMLLSGLPPKDFRIIYLKLVFYKQIAFPKKVLHREFLELVIPLPVNSSEILCNDYWNTEYNKLIEHFIEPYLTYGFIMHIQTMNLINLSIFLRQKYHCKIVSHIHCIPWKYYYTSNQQLFNQIYYKLNVERGGGENTYKDFITKNEFNIVNGSDAIICVTKNAKKYYEKYYRANPEKIHCIYNGIRDDFNKSKFFEIQDGFNRFNEPIRLLYVGSITRNKGCQFIFEALSKVHAEGYKFVLLAAGGVEEEMQKIITSKYKELDIRLLGNINYSKLQKLYESSHIGLIPSLFEQCCYVALEMSMYGLPVIYSGIKELYEIFNRKDNMFVPVTFSMHSSLSLNVCEFASKIMMLMKSASLRKNIGMRERDRFKKYFRQENMINKMITVYNNLF